MWGSFLLTAALAAPVVVRAASVPAGQDEHRDDHDKDNKRVYDRDHKDYHNWDANEDRRYREYLKEKHREYRPFVELKVEEQSEYWNWRHSHPDNDHH